MSETMQTRNATDKKPTNMSQKEWDNIPMPNWRDANALHFRRWTKRVSSVLKKSYSHLNMRAIDKYLPLVFYERNFEQESYKEIREVLDICHEWDNFCPPKAPLRPGHDYLSSDMRR